MKAHLRFSISKVFVCPTDKNHFCLVLPLPHPLYVFDSAPLIFIKYFALLSEFIIALLFWVASQSHRQNFQASNLSLLLLETAKPRRFLASSPSHLLPQRPDFHSPLFSCSNPEPVVLLSDNFIRTNVR